MYIALLGGSFNPVHIGHIRLAIEALECPFIPQALHRVDLIPCALPPHKSPQSLLPFNLRVDMLKAAVQDIPHIHVNALESLRQGPSYTWDTLTAYKEQEPTARLLFIVGGEDFATIPQWFRGLEFPLLTDIGMVPRDHFDAQFFCKKTQEHWPEATLINEKTCPHALFSHGARLLYLPLPRLDISASYIRQCWQNKKNMHLLMPDAALNILHTANAQTLYHWHTDKE